MTAFSSTTDSSAPITEVEETDDLFEGDDELGDDAPVLPPGIPKGFVIIDHMSTPHAFDVEARFNATEIGRLGLTATNVTLPVALMLMDPDTHPTFSRARKSCRSGSILIHRGPLSVDEDSGEESVFDPEKCIQGRVGGRVYPGDVIAIQTRLGSGLYNAQTHADPPFDLRVVYEDDHFAIVNKPAGVVTYAHRAAGHGRMTVRSALPFALTPPKAGTYSVISRPIAAHRLDKPTSGLLIVAKTKPAMVDITNQFVERKVKKTYTAIVNGIPDEPVESSITSLDAHKLGVDVDPSEDYRWQIINYTLDDKQAITVWRPLEYVQSLKARDNVLTVVELKPKTGRYHQLRRHMAWVHNCPLVGDKAYDGGGDAMAFRERGLFLCSNRVTLEHPYYNTIAGRKEWEALEDDAKFANGMLSLSADGVVKVEVSIDLPSKFESFLAHERARADKFHVDDAESQ